MKDINELHQWMEDNEYFELANELAIIRYKAMMWDKYQKEARIHKDLMRAIDVTHDAHEFREILEENKRELQEFGGGEAQHDPFAAEGGGLVKGTLQDRYDWVDDADPILNPHAHDELGEK